MFRHRCSLRLLQPSLAAPSDAPGRARQSPRLPADAVARRLQDRDLGRDSRTTMRMTLADRHGRMRERVLEGVTLRGPEGPRGPAAAPDGDRRLIRFSYPNDIRGTGFLVWEHPSAEDERFLFLPSLGRVRRIAGSETQDSFVGSDFTYEDIGGREFEEYVRLRGPDGETASWTAPGGRRARRGGWSRSARTPSAQFPRVVSLVLKDNFLVVAADVFNRRNERRRSTPSVGWSNRGHLDGDGLGDGQRAEKTRTELVVERADTTSDSRTPTSAGASSSAAGGGPAEA